MCKYVAVGYECDLIYILLDVTKNSMTRTK